MKESPHQIVMATGNQGKLAEIQHLLQGIDLEILAQSEFDFAPAEETGSSFVENALLKARQAARATGLMAIADDSGLAVDALDGEPGVYSARYAGVAASDAENVDKLLRALEGFEQQQRGASFHCVAVLVFPDESREPLIASGEWRGRIATSKRGDGGFGYDPVFFDPELGSCAAEMASDEKNARSHRGKAFRQLRRLLEEDVIKAESNPNGT